MIFFFWRGHGWWITWLTALGMFLPMIVLQQVDGPALDRGIGVAMTVVALLTFWLGLRWNRGRASGQPARHSFYGLPVQCWAIPMLVFAVLLGSGVITTTEDPPQPRIAKSISDGGLK